MEPIRIILLSMKPTPSIALLLLLYIVLIHQATQQCCLQYQNAKCVKCPKGMHLYQHNCIFDIQNCAEYADGFDCKVCKIGYTYDPIISQCSMNQGCKQGEYYDHTSQQCLNTNVGALRHLIENTQPTIDGFIFSHFEQENINQASVRYKVYYTKGREEIWFEFEADLKLYVFTFLRQSQRSQIVNTYRIVPVNRIYREVEFLFALAEAEKIDSRAKDASIESVEELQQDQQISFKIHFKFENSIQVMEITISLKDFKLVEKNNPDPYPSDIFAFISDNAKQGTQISDSQLQNVGVVAARQKLIEEYGQTVSDSDFITGYIKKKGNIINQYYLYYRNQNIYEGLVIEQTFTNRFFVTNFVEL